MDLEDPEPEQPDPKDEDEDGSVEAKSEKFQDSMDKYIQNNLYNGRGQIALQQVKNVFKKVYAEVIPLVARRDPETKFHYFSEPSPGEGERVDKSYDAYAIEFMENLYLLPNTKKINIFRPYFGGKTGPTDNFGHDHRIERLPTGHINDMGYFDFKHIGKKGKLGAPRTNIGEVKSMIAEIKNIIKQTRRLNEEE